MMKLLLIFALWLVDLIKKVMMKMLFLMISRKLPIREEMLFDITKRLLVQKLMMSMFFYICGISFWNIFCFIHCRRFRYSLVRYRFINSDCGVCLCSVRYKWVNDCLICRKGTTHSVISQKCGIHLRPYRSIDSFVRICQIINCRRKCINIRDLSRLWSLTWKFSIQCFYLSYRKQYHD